MTILQRSAVIPWSGKSGEVLQGPRLDFTRRWPAFKLAWGKWKRVLDLLEWIIPDDGPRLAFHARNTPIRVLEGRTIVEAVTAGQADKAARYLQTLSSGANGG